MGRRIGVVAHDPSGPSGHLPGFAREEWIMDDSSSSRRVTA